MIWEVSYLPDADDDMASPDGSQRLLVRKAIRKVSANPLPANEGGYGKPLVRAGSSDLTGFLKIKIVAAGIRVVYKLVRDRDRMLVVVIGARRDDEVYDIAQGRIKKYGL